MVRSRRTTMLRYFMIALFCLVVVKTAVRIGHYANPTAFSQARIS
jgi:hypothetical protein